MQYYIKALTTLLSLITCLVMACFCQGCRSEKRAKHVIGVSQCSADIWREKQNSELRMGAYLNGDVELRFAAAYDSDERQVQQIDSLVATGIDLLIVAPNQVATISPAIDRAYDSGLPVIVFERKTNSKKFTSFISADNYEMGRIMGEHVATRLKGKGHVLEVMGLEGSSPAIERHNGFADALQEYPELEIIATLQGDWTEESSYSAVKNYKGDLSTVDFVFGQNDRMAMGARKAVLEKVPESEAPMFCGIDGLPGEGGGIQLVRDSILDATYIYPTHGDRLLSVAIDILNHTPYDKELRLMSALVTSENARALQMQVDEIMRQADYLDQLHQRADNYLQQLDTQRTITFLSCGILGLLLIVAVLLYLYKRGRIILRRERVVNNLWNLEKTAENPESAEGTDDIHQTPVKKEEKTAEAPQTNDSIEDFDNSVSSSIFITHFKEVVETRLSDSELSIEDLAANMNLSRVQLYRKVKSITGSSPVELLRTARLNRGYQLLLTTDKTVSEVAYSVGFTAPSYFAKCFKEEFGHNPTEIKR